MIKQSTPAFILNTASTEVDHEKDKKSFSSSSRHEEQCKANNNYIPTIPNDICENISFSSASISEITIQNDMSVFQTSGIVKKSESLIKIQPQKSLPSVKTHMQEMPIKQEPFLKKENTYTSNEQMIIMEEQEPDCDNDYERNDCFIRMKLEEWNTSFYTLITIGSSLMYHDRIKSCDNKQGLAFTNPGLHTSIINFALIFASISVFLFIISSINRYMILLNLNKSTSKISRKTTFWNINYFPSFLLECIIALFHPNIFCKGITFKTSNSWYLEEVEYEVNDFLVLITIFRVYVFFRLVFSITTFYSSRSARIAQLIGTKLTRVFAMKCLVVVYPFYFLTIVGLFIVVMLSFMLKVIEGQRYDVNEGGTDYRPIQNCLWNILVTMTTVGYGDYFPTTNFGRIVNVFASISGSCLISLLTLSIQNALNFKDYEAKAFRTRQKELMREDIEKTAGNYFKASFQYLLARKKFRSIRKHSPTTASNVPQRQTTRQEMELALYEKIEKKRKFKDSIQFFRNIYEIPNETDTVKVKMEEFQEELNVIKDQSKDLKNLLNEINTIIIKDNNNLDHMSIMSSAKTINLSNNE